LTPPISKINPPAKTRLQKLPFNELSWENFERLCLRLIQREANIEHCQLYGKHGEKQEGIDIFARQKLSDKYRVYQCKRVKNFGPSKIEKAVLEFLRGSWANKSEMFVLCTQESFNLRKRAEELESQSKFLKQKGIILITWDNDQLSMKLKNIPELVDDFFGREWVKAFCGEEQAASLGKRLDAGKVAEFRQKFATFYKNVFSTHDPGLLIPTLGTVELLPLEERYVIPDIYEKRSIIFPYPEEGAKRKVLSEGLKSKYVSDESIERMQQIVILQRPSETYKQRYTIESWLINGDQSFILGGPGSGKSALLRFICIDLLKESPRLNLISQKWGEFLPIWIPFALWTKLISSRSDATCSLSELLHYFLKSWDEERLWPLVKQTLEDERLLLLVDGLDEWTNESAARIALDKLKVFIKQRKIPAIVTSRPHGFERLGMKETDWQIGELSEFSKAQQEKLSKIWFTQKIRVLSQDSPIETHQIDQKADTETKRFLAELQKSPDLRELAKIPLLLCLLIYHKFHNVRLPQSRFKAYDSLIEHLIAEHPQRRREVAFLNDVLSELTKDDIKMILACLAYHIQEHFGEGLINENKSLTYVRSFLQDCDLGLGLNHREARELSRKVLDVGENTIGLIVRRSPREISFFHRVFQEHLSAYHLSRMPFDDQLKIVQLHCSDPQWHEVILALFSLTYRVDDIKKFVDCIKEELNKANIIEKYAIELLLSETAFGDFNCSVDLTRELAIEAFKQIELGSWMPHREHILNYALEGLRLTKTKELVKTKLRHWFPCRLRYREGIFDAMANWPKLPEVVKCLIKGIHDEEPYNKWAASRALIHLGDGDSEIEKQIVLLSKNSIDFKTRASAIEALFLGWPKNEYIEQILELSRYSMSPELRLIAILGRIERNSQNDNDWNELVNLDSSDSGLDFHWGGYIAKALLKGWPKSPKTKIECFKALSKVRPDKPSLSRETALRILLEGFPQDQEVAEFCVEEIKNEKYPFISITHTPWRLLSKNFKEHPDIVAAIDEWLQNQEIDIPEISLAALVGRTPIAKIKLLSMLKSNFLFWPAEALIEGWGMKDNEVAKGLKKLAFGPIENSSRIGHLLPQIIEDKSTCRSRLLELLRDQNCKRLDFVMKGLLSLSNTQGDAEVVDSFFNLQLDHDIWEHIEAIGYLILGYSSDNRVKNLAVQELSKRNGVYACVARAYGDDEKIRQRIIEIACPLPVRLRKIISELLGEVESEEEFIMSLLQYYDHEQDSEVKTQASISYHNRLKASEKDTEQAVKKLSQSIVCYGPDHEERRQAAFCGLVSLGRLDIMVKAKERIGSERPCAISIARGISTNIPLIRYILQNWDDIKVALGSEFWSRLSKYKNDIFDIWNELCLFAEEYPLPRDEALHFLEGREDRKAKPNILRFLSRARPKSSLLLDYCLKKLHIGDDKQDTSGEDAVVAAELLGSHFGNDSDVLAQIMSGRAKSRIYQKVILALCEGWPESKELDQIFERVREQKWLLNYKTYLNLVCLKATSRKIFNILINELSNSEHSESRFLLFYLRPFIRRLRTDDELLNMLTERLQKEPTKSEKATIPKLVSEARGISHELRTWCIEEANYQLSGKNPPEIGVDLVSHEIRPVIHSLLDALLK
jgi:hypothetical protein